MVRLINALLNAVNKCAKRSPKTVRPEPVERLLHKPLASCEEVLSQAQHERTHSKARRKVGKGLKAFENIKLKQKNL
jgi:hypothetical protein